MEEMNGGTCEMAPEGGCLYHKGNINHVSRFKGDGLGRYGPEDFEALSEGMWWRVPGDDEEKLLGWADSNYQTG